MAVVSTRTLQLLFAGTALRFCAGFGLGVWKVRHQRVWQKPLERVRAFGDEKVANRDTKVWHGATETGP
jgi:hypothetical protein